MFRMNKNALMKILVVLVGLSLLLTACKAGAETDAVIEEPSAAPGDLPAGTGESDGTGEASNCGALDRRRAILIPYRLTDHADLHGFGWD